MKGFILGLFAAIGAFPLGNFATRLIGWGLESLGEGYGEGTFTIAPIVGLACAITAFNLARKKYGKPSSG